MGPYTVSDAKHSLLTCKVHTRDAAQHLQELFSMFLTEQQDLNPSKCNEKTSIDIKSNKITPHSEQEYLKLQREVAGLE